MILKKITSGITVTVEPQFEPHYSSIAKSNYIFSYKINIFNDSDYAIQVLRRFWKIADSCGMIREVEGEGVVGQTPVIPPQQHYEYSSFCDLKTGLGKMNGYYTVKRIINGTLFRIIIPEFQLIIPYILN